MKSFISKYYNTLRYLHLKQIYLRFLFKYYYPRISQNLDYKKREAKNIIYFPLNKNKSIKKSLVFLNLKKVFRQKIHWYNSNTSKLWNYNLHYFDYINSELNSLNLDYNHSMILNWISKNKSRKSLAWESYPTSLRIVNWIKWLLLNNKENIEIERSLLKQARWLNKRIEYHLQGNHLIANAKALIFVGLFFNTTESEGWLNKGSGILIDELDKQILNDGGHFELSPMYHLIILDDFLDILNILKIYEFDKKIIFNKIEKNLNKMFYWADTMSHPDQDLSFFNDSVFDIAPRLPELRFYASNLELDIKSNKKEKNINQLESTEENQLDHLEESGYIKLRNNKISLILDVADIKANNQPGHTHADTLSFEMSIGNDRVIVNSGLSTYEISKQRHFQRSTKAHNTLEINSKNSSEVWSSFRVGKRARVKNLKIDHNIKCSKVLAAHDGYKGILHTREWIMKSNIITIKDFIDGEYETAILRFYLHPNIEFLQRNILKLTKVRSLEIVSNNTFNIVDASWYPEFGKSIKNKCIEMNVINGVNEIQLKILE